MTERLLQFIWQFQYFNKNELTTAGGESLQIIYCGQYNTDQGPDFIGGKIRIGKTVWAGAIELHVKTSDWKKHYHQNDPNYKNVILHAVWENDLSVNEVPVIELRSRVSKILLQRYTELMHSGSFIPCEKMIGTVKEITWKSWKERLLAERLLRKSKTIENCLQQTNFHWEETFWWLLARSFGMKTNSEAFEAIARTLSLKVLTRHKNQPHQLEALLLGQAGLLNRNSPSNHENDDYSLLLKKEYKFLQKKYKLKSIHVPVHFLRMRPGNFPSLRLAQIAMLIHHSAHLFSRIRETVTVKEIKTRFDITANDYWHYHYRLGKTSSFKKKNIGEAMIETIIINTVCPLLFAYGNYHSEAGYKNKALSWLEQVAAENNLVTRGFMSLKLENKTAYDSQALIELKNEYCNNYRCLECAVGNAILKPL